MRAKAMRRLVTKKGSHKAKLGKASRHSARTKLGHHIKRTQSVTDLSPLLLMREVNKLIFVQDFDRAALLLTKLARQWPDNYEVHFRRIEVASRGDDLESLRDEYQAAATQRPEVLALRIAATLAEIRILDRGASGIEAEETLMNPSLGENHRVVGLSMNSEESFGGDASLQFRTPSRSMMFSRGTGETSARIRGRVLHIDRSPAVTDDAVPLDASLQPEIYVDDEAKLHQGVPVPEEISRHPILSVAIELTTIHPDNYGVWYVAGCAYEYGGELTRAIDAWTRAAELQPNSISVLATMAELQQIGALSSDEDYAQRFEALDKNLVHGAYETHTELYKEFIARGEYRQAIAALRTLADWIQRQRGDVPTEIEVLCLLGAMRAYSLEGNMSASEACRREVERLVITCKKSPRNATQLCFIAQICEEYGLKNLAKILYLSVLTSADTPVDLIVRIAAHTVTTAASPALKECLKTAYRNTNGHPEVRFCQLLCSLFVANVPVERYMKRKGDIRDLISQNEIGQAFPLLAEALKDTNDDPEIHFYMGDLLTRLGVADKARQHFETMYELDPMNAESVMRYINFLLKVKDYPLLKEVAKHAMEVPNMTASQLADLHWARAFASGECDSIEEARLDIQHAIKYMPWNKHYLCLQLNILEADMREVRLPGPKVIEQFLKAIEQDSKEYTDDFMREWLNRAEAAMEGGYVEYAYVMTKCALLVRPKLSSATSMFIKTSAAFDSRLAVQQLLQLHNTNGQEAVLTFAELALVTSQIYVQTGEWALVKEWCDIAERAGVEGKAMRAKQFELEALVYAMTGVQLKKAQSLLEASFDAYDAVDGAPTESIVIYNYILAMQGDNKAAVEKLQVYLDGSRSIFILYFVIKGLTRSGQLVKTYKGPDPLRDLFKLKPTNPLELKLLEEIHCLLGTEVDGESAHLAC